MRWMPCRSKTLSVDTIGRIAGLSLGDQDPIERVPVLTWQSSRALCVVDVNRQLLLARVLAWCTLNWAMPTPGRAC